MDKLVDIQKKKMQQDNVGPGLFDATDKLEKLGDNFR